MNAKTKKIMATVKPADMTREILLSMEADLFDDMKMSKKVSSTVSSYVRAREVCVLNDIVKIIGSVKNNDELKDLLLAYAESLE